MNNKQLYQISKYTYEEAFLQSQLNMAGSSLNNIMEKMEKNTRYLKTQNILVKIIMVIYISLLIFLPISVFKNINIAVESGVPISWAFFYGSSLLGAYFFIQILYMLMFGMFYITGLFSGEVFQWLSTLPVERKNLGKICLWTFFRSVDAPFIALMLVFPIAAVIMTQNLLVFIISLVISGLNTVLAFCLLIILGKKFTGIITSGNGKSSKNSRVQLLFYIGYLIVTFVAVLGFQYGMPAIERGFTSIPTNLDFIEKLTDYLGLIFFPLSGSYLIVSFTLGISNISLLIVLFSILGIALFIRINIYLMKKAKNTLNEVVYPKNNIKEINSDLLSKIEDVKVTTISPLRSYVKKDLQMVGRDYQSLMMLLMPFVLMTVGYFIGTQMGDGDFSESFSSFMTIYILYGIMGSFMQTFGIMNLESTGSTITAALPMIPRERAKAKLIIMITTIGLSSLIPGMILLFSHPISSWLRVYLLILPIPTLFVVIIFLFKIRLFGKLKNKYVLEEIHLKNKTGKIVGMGFTLFIFGLLLAIVIGVMLSNQQIELMLAIFIPSEIVSAIVLYLIYNKMFPKPPQYLKNS